jgi:methyl-accepting chemotaxis protein
LRHDTEAALKRKVLFDTAAGYPVLQAVQGRNGSGIADDYRGKKVIATWRYIPSINWGVVAKIDINEAFAPISRMKNIILLLVFASMILVTATSFIVAKSISDPINRLNRDTKIIGSGNLDYKVAVTTNDEIGQLSIALNKMTEDLKNTIASRDELNKQIAERRKAEENLQDKMRQLEIFNKAAVDRELKIIEMKRKVGELEERLRNKP